MRLHLVPSSRVWNLLWALPAAISLIGCGEQQPRTFGNEVFADAGGPDGGLVRGKGDATNIYVVTGGDAGAGDAGIVDGDVKATGGASGAGGATASGGRSGSGGGTPGSGGAAASGGTRGSGGAPGTGGGSASGGRGSGGAPASGGGPGTGGASATGGRGTGGASSSGGAPSTGGASASGGRGSGGVSATGGAPGEGGRPGNGGAAAGGGPATTEECERLIRDYDNELMKARECRDLIGSCATSVPLKLAGCGSTCPTFVEKADKLMDLQKKWTKEGCTAPACAREVCANPLTSLCSVTDGTCSDVL